jgi:pyrroloquinoline-quinone synthase
MKDSAKKTTELAGRALEEIGIADNPFLLDLESEAMTLDQFKCTQEQFFFAVTFFPRPMACLVARIFDPKRRLDILHNVVEEHGEFDERAFHHSTFLEFLDRIGCNAGEVEKNMPLHASVRAFNSTLAAACALDELEVGVAAMGTIELAFSSISARIGKAVIARKWLPRERMIHYALHASIDPRHAEEFFLVLEPTFDERRYFIEQGARLGAYIFDRLYRDLPRARPPGTAASRPVPQQIGL